LLFSCLFEKTKKDNRKELLHPISEEFAPLKRCWLGQQEDGIGKPSHFWHVIKSMEELHPNLQIENCKLIPFGHIFAWLSATNGKTSLFWYDETTPFQPRWYPRVTMLLLTAFKLPFIDYVFQSGFSEKGKGKGHEPAIQRLHNSWWDGFILFYSFYLTHMEMKRKEYFIQIETGKQLINLINYKNSGEKYKKYGLGCGKNS